MSFCQFKYLIMCLFLILISLFFSLAIIEFVARISIEKSDVSYGVLWGSELPPYRVVPVSAIEEPDGDGWYQDLVVEGKRITISDLWGRFREDEVTAWAPLENAVSTNGWWRTNRLGARSLKEFSAQADPEITRVLVFGDSFTQGSRLPQHDTWAYRLSEIYPSIEVINFGVDGFGMGQSLLRFKQIRDRISYDHVVFVLVPRADLWRDVNTLRSLRGWDTFILAPRFYLEGEELKLARSPYDSRDAFLQANSPTLSGDARYYLKEYDRFYSTLLHEDLPILGYLISYKLLAKNLGDRQIRSISRRTLYNLNSEAWQVTRAIFHEANASAAKNGATFSVAVLPSLKFVDMARRNQTDLDFWREMIANLDRYGFHTIDLLPPLLQEPAGHLDAGYDGSHYGPRTSEIVAEHLGAALAVSVAH